jgi:hypothetical protein
VFYNQTVKPNKFYFSEKLINSIKFSNINFSLKKILKIVKNRKNKDNHIENKKIKFENFLYLNNLKKDFLDRSAKF